MPHTPAALLALLIAASAANAQTTRRSVFVANNGNLEGSVSSLRVHPDGSVSFRDKYVTGTRPNTQVFHPGTNCQSISISPDGKYLAVGHGTSSTTFEQLTILAVGPDESLSLVGLFSVPDSPLYLKWIRDRVLAVAITSSPSRVNVYRFDPDAPTPSLTLIDTETSGSFCTWLALHSSNNFLFSQTTGTNTIFSFSINPDDTLSPNGSVLTAAFPLDIGASPDGTKIYGGGGISSGSRAVVGAHIAPDGTLSLMPGSPFFSPGNSPKQVVVSSDNAFAFVAHGSDSTVRSFTIDQPSGAINPTGFLRTVGQQGSLGEIGVMDNLLIVLDRDTLGDGVRGVLSFTILPDGSFPINGTITDTNGISPWTLALWSPPCSGDANGDRIVNFADLNLVLSNFGQSGPSIPGDVNGDGVVNFADLNLVLSSFGVEC